MRITAEIIMQKDSEKTRVFMGLPNPDGRRSPIRALYIEKSALGTENYVSGTVTIELKETSKKGSVAKSGVFLGQKV
jgi:hypothetical protein